MNEKNLRKLIAEATVDCYGEDEEFWGMLAVLEDELNFPLAAKLIGETVELLGLDSEACFPHRGIVAVVRRKGREYSVGLAELEFTSIDSHSAEWLAAYRLWLRR